MEKELMTVTSREPSLTAVEVRKQVNLIQEVMSAVMVGPTKENPSGVHYGIIPGCKLPSLYKAGAEKLAMTFRLGSDFEELSGSTESDSFICYKINCKLFYIPTGNVVGNGRGVCNSKEKKYRARMVYANKATAEEKSIGKEEERHGDKGSCKVYIIPQNPWDVQNTIYKMACKRAMVAAIINATGASDIFSQDVEDLPEGTVLESEGITTGGKPHVEMPKEKAPDALVYTDVISLAQAKIGGVYNVQAYGVSIKNRIVGKDKKDITDFIVGDLPKDPTAQISISVWGKLDAGAGQLIKFNQVTVGEYKEQKTFLAKEVIHG
jgi:hypothetical protein